jgi:regulator of RNase E activity RraA
MFSKRQDEVRLQVPIQCGGVIVSPGDMIVGDEIGVTVIAGPDQENILRLAREQAEREEKTRRAIASGKTYAQLLEEFGRI